MNELLKVKGMKSPCGLIPKMPMRMRITSVLLAGFLFQANAETLYSQSARISLEMNDATVEQVLEEIEAKSEFYFLYNNKLINVDRRVSVDVDASNIDSVLKQVFAGTDVEYKIADKQIILSRKQDSSNAFTSITQQNNKITGTVLDETGTPVIGANVAVQGTTNGTVTDLDGNFVLNVPKGSTLVISYIGYTETLVKVGNENSLKITLKEDSQALDEVVVVGYGKMKKGDLSAAVSSIANVDKLMERPISNAQEMLQGQIPGVTVVSNGGRPDEAPTITIRGMGSRSGEAPLYVVDGVPGAPFNFSDVVSMTVLKDAASAAIYGAYAGSAGVILVTTKQAAPGKTSVSYDMVTGFSQAYNLPQSLTIEEERMVRAKSLGFGSVDELAANITGWDVNKNPYIGETRTDWVDAIFRNAPFQRHNVAISGGTEEFSNRASVEYSNKQGTLINTYNKSITLRLNSMWKVNNWIQLREDLSWQDVQKRGADTWSAESGVIVSALKMPRNAEVYGPDGSYGGTAPSDEEYIKKYGSNYADIHGDAVNPVRALTDGNVSNHTSYLTSSTFFDIKEPIKGLNFTSRFTYKLRNFFLRQYSTRRLEPGKPENRNFLLYESQREPQWDLENTLTYDRVFNRHNVGLMASTTANDYSVRRFSAIGRDFQNEDESLMYFDQAGQFDRPRDGFVKDRNVSFVGRASYSFADRYFVTASWRRDYAGRLPKGQKYGDFPSATVAWKLTSEPFMPKSDVLNMLKLRASWGRIGNLGSINRGYGYQMLSTHIIQGGDCGGQIGDTNPIIFGKYYSEGFNPFLTWETSEQLDFGIDLNMFNNRFGLTADYFYKKTTDLIKRQDSGWTNSIGMSPMLINDGEIHNSGVEIAANWSDKVGKVDYWISGNMATLKNRVHNIGAANDAGEKPVWTDGAGYRELSPYRTEEGQPMYSFWLVETDGIFMNQSEIDQHVGPNGEKIQPNAQVGDLKFIDQNNDGVINADDRVTMGNSMPKVTYSLSGGLTWNNFTFSLMLQGVGGVKIFNAYKYSTLNESMGNYNRSNEILKAFNGPNKEVPRITANDENGNFSTNSDFYLEKGDYLRIKNVSLGYSFTDLFRKCGYLNDRKSSLSVTLSVDNLATFTSYSGIDPEVGGIGFDAGQYPVSRTYSVGVKLKF